MSEKTPSYKPLPFIKGDHLETMVPGLFRRVKLNPTSSATIPTPDKDFLELDWYEKSSEVLIIISHGLEGNATRAYMKGMAKIFNSNGYSALCWNYRGCGSRLNSTPRLYHSGATEDLQTVVAYAIGKGYKQIGLVGFSLGGNLTLKYVGETGSNIPTQLKFAIAYSVPVDLAASCRQISLPQNRLYANRFLRKLKKKVKLKSAQFPSIIFQNGLSEIKDLKTFDDCYTAPIHGYQDANEYYRECSSLQFLPHISIPTLIVNGANDPFLPKECYPEPESISNSNIVFEYPKHGGHVGFMSYEKGGHYWSETRALEFANDAFAIQI